MTEALRTDLYQLTMMQAYWTSGHNPEATFDYFVRKIPFGSYLMTAGLTYVLDYIENLHFEDDDIGYLRTQGFNDEFLELLHDFKFAGDILAMPEGSIAFPLEPIIRVTAPIIQAQLVETFILNKMNFSTLIATKASRVVYAAKGRAIAEFGLRRAQGDGHLEATRATYIGGCASTSNVLAGKKLGIPVSGTMAHSFVTSFDHEIDSFRAYAEAFPKKCFLLIDTYNSIEGAKKAVIVGKELEKKGEKLLGVRLDSGDLSELSKQVRRILDEAGLTYVKIVASGDLNEWKIDELMNKGAKIDMFGVGTELITGRPPEPLPIITSLAGFFAIVTPSFAFQARISSFLIFSTIVSRRLTNPRLNSTGYAGAPSSFLYISGSFEKFPAAVCLISSSEGLSQTIFPFLTACSSKSFALSTISSSSDITSFLNFPFSKSRHTSFFPGSVAFTVSSESFILGICLPCSTTSESL